MKIYEYVEGVKTIKRTDILTRVSTLQVIATDLLANLERMEVNKIDLNPFINNWAITKSIVKGLESNGLRGVGFIKAVESSLTSVVGLMDGLEKEISKTGGNTWDGAVMNLRQANYLIVIEQVDQWLTYTRLVFDVLITMHNSKVQGSPDSLMGKVDLRMINQTLEYYKGTFMFLLKGSKRILMDLTAVPEVQVNEHSLSVLEGMGTQMQVSQELGIHHFNPVFWWNNNRMKLDVKAIETARQENETFAMKISQAVHLKNGTNDAVLDERIKDYEDRIVKNVHAIEEIKGKYAKLQVV